MRRSIRDQILIPLFAVQLGTVATIALVAARVAADRVEGQVTSRLEGVVETLGRSNFPLTGGVLAKMRGLSGAHFATIDEAGRILDSTLPGLAALPPGLADLPINARLEAVSSSTKWDIEGERYFAGSTRSGTGPTLLVLYPESAWRRARWEAGLAPLGIGVLSMAPMAAVTGLVAHRLGRRLGLVEERVAAIAGGDFRPMVDLEPGDEVDALVRSIDRMAGQLRNLTETIRRTERAGVMAQLAAGLAHQLRNAAAGARMAVQLHARRCQGPQGDGSLEVAIRQLSICEEQVKALLAPDRSGAGVSISLDASDMMAEVALLVDPTCRHQRIKLDLIQAPGFSIRADPDDLRAAILNLALNAIEAAGPGGRVEFSTSADHDWVHLDVIDDGPGPSTELATSMFEPFVTGKPEGIGLGLALARRVALSIGGELSWSRQEGRTRFRLAIPRSAGGGLS